jgi:transposase
MQFFDHMAELAVVQDGFTAIMEICGFNDWLVEMLHEYGCRKVVLVQPESRDVHKTDRRDANQLSQLLWLNRLRLQEGKSIEGVRQVRPPLFRTPRIDSLRPCVNGWEIAGREP